MRIFSLATDQAVVIGDGIVVKVIEIDGEEVRLGIENSDGMLTDFDWVDKSRRQVEMEPVP